MISSTTLWKPAAVTGAALSLLVVSWVLSHGDASAEKPEEVPRIESGIKAPLEGQVDAQPLVALAEMGQGPGKAEQNRPQSLQQVVQQVQANEALYQDIELVYQDELRGGDPEKLGDVDPELLNFRSSRRRVVFQNGLVYMKQHGSEAKFSGKKYEGSYELGYDGKVTRTLSDKGAYANIHHGRSIPSAAARPHMLLFHHYGIGDRKTLVSALQAERGTVTRYKWSVSGWERLDGIECVKLKCEFRRPGRKDNNEKLYLTHIFWVWLSRQHNY